MMILELLGDSLEKILFLLFGLLLPFLIFLTALEKKWNAAIQDRIGSARASVKLIVARAILSFLGNDHYSVRRFSLKNTSLFFYFIPILVIFAVIPLGMTREQNILQIADPVLGIFLVFALETMQMIFPLFATYQAKAYPTKISSIRASSQMFFYRAISALALIGVVMSAGSAKISAIVLNQNQYWMDGIVPKWGIFCQPLAFILFFISASAVIRRTPFDSSTSSFESFKGYKNEFSNSQLGFFFLAEKLSMLSFSALLVTFFLGSYHLPWISGSGRISFYEYTLVRLPAELWPLIYFISFSFKTIFVCWLQIVIGKTISRMRFDQSLNIAWRVLIPLALLNVFLTGIFILNSST